MSTTPEVTVMVPVYNRERLVARCLESVAGQRTAASYEVLVVDDCSTDATAEVARTAGARVVSTGRNLGCGGARNVGFAAAAGEWVAFLDSDDWWAPDHLQTLLEHAGGVAFVAASALTTVGGRRRVVGNPWPRRLELGRPGDVLAPENVVAISAAMVRADVVRRTGGFPVRRFADDLELWTRLLASYPGRVLPDLTVAYGTHGGQVSSDPGMAAGSAELFLELQRRGAISEGRRRALETIAVWDARPQSWGRWLARSVAAGRIDPRALAWLLAARAGQRHRWRLQPSRARLLAERSVVAV